jgi:hypothetical protein
MFHEREVHYVWVRDWIIRISRLLLFFSFLLHPAYHLFNPSQLPRVNKSGCKLDTQLIASQITPGLGGTQHQILNREAKPELEFLNNLKGLGTE